MNNKINTIEIESDNTLFSISTYGTWFELDESNQILDSEVEYYQEEGLIPSDIQIDWSNIDDYLEVEYLNKEYLEALAEACTDYLAELVSNSEYSDMLELKQAPNSVTSPREYNFVGDSHKIAVSYDPGRLAIFIAEHWGEYQDYFAPRWKSRDGFISFIDEYDEAPLIMFALEYIAAEEAEEEDPRQAFCYEMLDRVSQWEYLSVTPKQVTKEGAK